MRCDAGFTAMPVAAELVVSDLVVELHADSQLRKDIEVWNNSDERSYVEISPAEILIPAVRRSAAYKKLTLRNWAC